MVEGLIAYLDGLDGDADLEPSLCGLTITDPSGTGHDEEGPDDNGVADDGGLAWVCGSTRSVEEFNRRLARGRL